ARPDTVFRTASVAKMACALLVFRLQTLGRLDVNIDISDLWGDRIRNPLYPDTPIPLSALLSHTSGIVDSALYYSSFQKTVPVRELLADPATYANRPPFARFQYSNFAAGLVGCLLEKRFGESFETLAQRELFLPLGADATFDISALCGRSMADSYRVLPPQKSASFNAQARFQAASPLDTPDPQTHYLLASGSLFITAEGLARLTLPLIQRAAPDCAPFLNPEACRAMLTPTAAWPEPAVRMRHGMGLLEMDDPRIHPHCLHGHQGFAYGAVNGVFFDEHGNGFASLNSGASERRLGHLSCLNRDLIALCIPGVSE
ncbi:MAG TPA: serine hydrolase domain-containing protein, partial [Candidatus Limiplasma sp.]|nr:serine hydrolase domain-containing protein [Candidatus Limiplasma sp.]